MGVPLLVGLLGVQVSAPVIITILIDLRSPARCALPCPGSMVLGWPGPYRSPPGLAWGFEQPHAPVILLGAWFSIGAVAAAQSR